MIFNGGDDDERSTEGGENSSCDQDGDAAYGTFTDGQENFFK